jgi:hypothetical protein
MIYLFTIVSKKKRREKQTRKQGNKKPARDKRSKNEKWQNAIGDK